MPGRELIPIHPSDSSSVTASWRDGVGSVGAASSVVGTVRLMGDFLQIRYDVVDRVATITLNRPDKLNAFTTTMMRELIAAYTSRLNQCPF